MINLLISLLIMAICLFYGILYENTSIIMIAYALLILLLVSIVEVLLRFFTTSCRMHLPVVVTEENTQIQLLLKLQNKGFLPGGRVDAHVAIRNVFHEEGESYVFTVP